MRGSRSGRATVVARVAASSAGCTLTPGRRLPDRSGGFNLDVERAWPSLSGRRVGRLVRSLPLFVLFLAALVLRLGQQHSALIYPDGYQYLLMARGISEHLQPTTVLGSGGDRFVPNPDAALKPFFPLLVAAFHTSGVSWLRAAQGVTATAGAATVAATALLATRVGRSSARRSSRVRSMRRCLPSSRTMRTMPASRNA